MALDQDLAELVTALAEGRRTVIVAGEPYGVHYVYPAKERRVVHQAVIFAEDDCGNWIAQRQATGEVIFIDHETDNITTLAPDVSSLIARLVEWRPNTQASRVIRAWIDPELKKSSGEHDT